MKINEKQLFADICGIEDNESKAIVVVKLTDIDVKTGDEYVLDTLTVNTPVVNIYKSPAMSFIDLTFIDPTDKDFYELITKLNEFCNIDMQPSSDDTMRTIIIECVPKDDSVSFVAGFHAIWSVMPSKPGAKIDTLRFFIDTEYLHAFVINEDALEEEENDEDQA